ncbi:MAG: fimbrial protein, partial [Dyella sp.]|nr:fimbrial protein [Dyella sp.]
NILKNTGTATGVGIQISDGGGNPVTLGTPTVVGTAASGAQSIPYLGSYYSTAASVGQGSVASTATFTLTYQ